MEDELVNPYVWKTVASQFTQGTVHGSVVPVGLYPRAMLAISPGRQGCTGVTVKAEP
jgi:hypothetical protein